MLAVCMDRNCDDIYEYLPGGLRVLSGSISLLRSGHVGGFMYIKYFLGVSSLGENLHRDGLGIRNYLNLRGRGCPITRVLARSAYAVKYAIVVFNTT